MLVIEAVTNNGMHVLESMCRPSTVMDDCGAVFGQSKCQTAREISAEERQRLDDDKPISEFKQAKLEKEALKNWDLFYKRNGTRFFKDRHWTGREFTELAKYHALKVYAPPFANSIAQIKYTAFR